MTSNYQFGPVLWMIKQILPVLIPRISNFPCLLHFSIVSSVPFCCMSTWPEGPYLLFLSSWFPISYVLYFVWFTCVKPSYNFLAWVKTHIGWLCIPRYSRRFSTFVSFQFASNLCCAHLLQGNSAFWMNIVDTVNACMLWTVKIELSIFPHSPKATNIRHIFNVWFLVHLPQCHNPTLLHLQVNLFGDFIFLNCNR